MATSNILYNQEFQTALRKPAKGGDWPLALEIKAGRGVGAA